MQPRLLLDGVAQGDISGQGDDRDAAPRERGLHGNLQDPRHLLGLGNQLTVMAALREEMFRDGFPENSRCRFRGWESAPQWRGRAHGCDGSRRVH